jgi:hypothetical protein
VMVSCVENSIPWEITLKLQRELPHNFAATVPICSEIQPFFPETHTA